MAYNLRLPPALDADARERCQRLGISLNALLCVALDAYLRQPATLPAGDAANPTDGFAAVRPDGAARSVPAPDQAARQPTAPKLSKQQRREITRLDRQARKV